jgi:Fe2+ or Zn2+ uptake regulation protein
MRTLITKIDSFLREKGIKASYQRLRIFDYLQKSKEHPTVSTIYDDLLPEIPSLSRATVYNTLNLFVDKKIAKVLPLEDHESRFDIMAEDHAHFRCDSCGEIFDIPSENIDLRLKNMPEFSVLEKEILIKGTCSRCQSEN